jgi:hypothetical protein
MFTNLRMHGSEIPIVPHLGLEAQHSVLSIRIHRCLHVDQIITFSTPLQICFLPLLCHFTLHRP